MTDSQERSGDAPEHAEKQGDSASIRITQAQAYSYRVPEASASQSRRTNVIVVFKAETSDGRVIEGVGEGQPRSWRTGDDAGDYWKFLADAVERLQDQTFRAGDRAEALNFVRTTMADAAATAESYVMEPGYRRPFRGTMLGLEVALLDLIAKARQETLAQLLGQKRDVAPLAAPALSMKSDYKKVKAALTTQAERYRRIRITGSADLERTLDFGELVTAVNRSRSIGKFRKPLWIELNGALSREAASRFVREVVRAAAENRIPGKTLIEQPVPMRYSDHLAVLQREAVAAAEELGKPDLDIRIMGDESIWDVHSMSRMEKLGGLRAVNIRPAQAGGLLASMDLAERVLGQDPEARIFLTRMVGASRLTASALRHLALALPRIDGAVVNSVVESELDMTRRASVDGKAQEEDQGAGPGFADELDPITSQLRIIAHDDSDYETESEGEDTSEGADSLEVKRRSRSETADSHESASVSAEDVLDARSDSSFHGVGQEAPVGRDSYSDLRTFSVRSVPGVGIDLRFAGLVSDVRDAVTFPAPPEATYHGIPVTRYTDVDDLHPLGPNGSKGHLLEREALALGLNTTRYSKGGFTATDGKHDPILFKWSRNPMSSAASLALCTHKEATRMQLQQAGVPVPQGRTFARGDYATARDFAARIGYPVVVKPAMGVRGIGVVAGIQDEEQLDAAFKLMAGSKLGNQDFIVEKHVNGADYRIVVIGDEVIAAILREPASVFGDGKSTIAELLISKNIARKRNPHLWARPAKYDEAAQHELRKAGRTLDTVLAEGEQQLLANTCSLSQGGDSIDVLDELHPSIKEASVRAVKAMPGLHFCGVDFLLEDHTKPLNEQDAGVCELNAHAAIGNCEYPMFGTGRPVAKTLIKTTIEHYGLEASEERADTVALHLTIRGRVTRTNYRKWLQRRANVSGVSGWVRNVGRRAVEAVLVGPTDPTTAVAAATILGPRGAVPTAYEARHIPVPDNLDGFEIREDAPNGTRVEAVDAA